MNRILDQGHLFRIAILCALGMLIVGCASLNKAECENANWRVIGYEDGVSGHSGSRIGSHRKACAKHGIAPDMQTYNQGREDGLKEFCRPQRGYQEGLRGKRYGGVCSGNGEAEFLAAYNYGKKIHGVKSEIQVKQRHIRGKEEELKKLKQHLQAKEQQLINGNTPPEVRLSLLNESKEMSKKQGGLEAEIQELKLEIAKMEGNAEQLVANSRYH